MDERISADKVMKFGLRGYKEYIDYNWHGLMIKIRTLLSRDEEYEIVRSVVECCTCYGDNGEEYIVPENLELALRANVVIYYTDILLPNDIDEQHTLLFYSNLYDVVIEHANKAQIDSIFNTLYRRI